MYNTNTNLKYKVQSTMQIRKVVDKLTRQYRLEKLQIRHVVVDNLTRQYKTY